MGNPARAACGSTSTLQPQAPCHGSRAFSASTAIPRSSARATPAFLPTKTCINCHSQIWTNAQLLEPVRQSWATGESIRWIRVHDLPDYVYFNHSIHVNKGIGCSSCHGRVDLMPIMYQENSLQMEWCLNCHRNPAKNLRPTSEVYNMAWAGPSTGKPVWCGTHRRQERDADRADGELHDGESGAGGSAHRFAGHAAADRSAGDPHAGCGSASEWRCRTDRGGQCELHQVHQPGGAGPLPAEAIPHPRSA